MPLDDTVQGAALAAELDAPAATIVAHLAKNPISPLADTLAIGDFVESTFPGYAPITLDEWEVEICDFENYAEGVSTQSQWESGNVVTPEVVTAIYITEQFEGGAAFLIGVEILDPPIIIDRAGIEIAPNVHLNTALEE